MDFIPSIPVMSAFTLAALILTLTPGPDMSFFIGRSLTQGRASGMAAMLGASTGNIIHTLLAAFGISALIQASPTGFLILKIAGAIYLLWLAFQAVREGSTFTPNREAKKQTSLLNDWLTGIGINMLNPKIVIFFITFLPQFVTTSDSDAAAKMIFLGCYFVLIAILCCSVIVYAADKVSSSLRQNPKVTRIIDWVFAGVFSAFAVRIMLTER
jgi:threonine/homoserine/homoserine lactone efflux protein